MVMQNLYKEQNMSEYQALVTKSQIPVCDKFWTSKHHLCIPHYVAVSPGPQETVLKFESLRQMLWLGDQNNR